MHKVSVLAGHAVRSSSLVSVGCDGAFLAYGCAVDIFVICSLQGNSDASMSTRDDDFFGVMQTVSLERGEQLSVIHLHQTKDLMCIGTAHNGLYLSTASNPVLCANTTKISPRLTGEKVFSLCFINGFDKVPDVLVASCGLQESSKERFRLSIWDVHARVMLWRGCADVLDSIVALPGIFGFASCTQRNVTLFTIQRQESNGEGKTCTDGGSGLKKESTKREEGGEKNFSVLSKPCSVVNELRDAEFVAILPPIGSEETLTALTTVGFLVSFDCRSGAPVKWMDSKVCPATTAYRNGNEIVVCGTLVRFFSFDKWEFRGKIKAKGSPTVVNSSFLTRLMDSLCTGAAVCSNDRLVLFCSGGEMSRYCVIRPLNGAGKLTFRQVYQHSPVLLDEVPLRWIPLTANTLILWSPQRLRFYDTSLQSNIVMPLEGTCVAHHRDLGVLLVYESSAYEVVAVVPNLERKLFSLTVTEPLTSLVAHKGNQFVGVSPNNSLFYFEGQWKEAHEFELRALHTTRLTNFKRPLTHLLSVGGALYAASTHFIANLQTGNSVDFGADIISFASTDDNVLLVAHSHCCVVVNAVTLQPIGEPIQVAALNEVVPALTGDFVALCGETEVSVVSLTDRQRVAHFGLRRDADDPYPVVPLSVGITADNGNLVLCDSRGLFTLCALPVTGAKAVNKVMRVSRPQRRQAITKRSLSCGGPTSVELQTRFQDLHGFYKNTRRVQREHDGGQKKSDIMVTSEGAKTNATTISTSGVLILAQGDSILQIPSGSVNTSFPPLRKWESDRTPVELPQVICPVDGPDVGVSTSVMEVSALTSVESKLNLNFSTLAATEAVFTPSLVADPPEKERGRELFADVPVYGMQSPARKGQPSISPIKTPEDDVVNIDSTEAEDLHRQLYRDPVVVDNVRQNSFSTVSNLSNSVRARSLEVCDALKELAMAYEQNERGSDSVVDGIDDEIVEEMFTTVSRLYAKVQSRQQRRPDSASSFLGSDVSSASINVVLADLQRLQSRSKHIEEQNDEILARLRAK